MPQDPTPEEIKAWYEVLELNPEATEKEVKQAYEQLSFVWQLDRFPEYQTNLRSKAQEKLKQIDTAYLQLRKLQRQQARRHKKNELPVNYSFPNKHQYQKKLQQPRKQKPIEKLVQDLSQELNQIKIEEYIVFYLYLMPSFILYLSISGINIYTNIFLLIINIPLFFITYYWGQAASIQYIYHKKYYHSVDHLTCLENTQDKIFKLMISDIYLIVLTILGIITFIFPGLYFAWMTPLRKQILVLEDTKPKQSIQQSWKLLKRNRQGVGLLLFLMNFSYLAIWIFALSNNTIVSTVGQIIAFIISGYIIISSTICYDLLVPHENLI